MSSSPTSDANTIAAVASNSSSSSSNSNIVASSSSSSSNDVATTAVTATESLSTPVAPQNTSSSSSSVSSATSSSESSSARETSNNAATATTTSSSESSSVAPASETKAAAVAFKPKLSAKEFVPSVTAREFVPRAFAAPVPQAVSTDNNGQQVFNASLQGNVRNVHQQQPQYQNPNYFVSPQGYAQAPNQNQGYPQNFQNRNNNLRQQQPNQQVFANQPQFPTFQGGAAPIGYQGGASTLQAVQMQQLAVNASQGGHPGMSQQQQQQYQNQGFRQNYQQNKQVAAPNKSNVGPSSIANANGFDPNAAINTASAISAATSTTTLSANVPASTEGVGDAKLTSNSLAAPGGDQAKTASVEIAAEKIVEKKTLTLDTAVLEMPAGGNDVQTPKSGGGKGDQGDESPRTPSVSSSPKAVVNLTISSYEDRGDYVPKAPQENIAALLRDRSVRRYWKVYFLSLFKNTKLKMTRDGKYIAPEWTKKLADHYCKASGGKNEIASIKELQYREPYGWQECEQFIRDNGPNGVKVSLDTGFKAYVPKAQKEMTVVEHIRDNLNKISAANKDKIFKQVTDLDFSGEGVVKQAVEIIIQKAKLEHGYIDLYAELTKTLCDRLEKKYADKTEENKKKNPNYKIDDKDRIGKGFRFFMDFECREEYSTRIKEQIATQALKEFADSDDKNKEESILFRKYEGLMFLIADLCNRQVIRSENSKTPGEFVNPLGRILNRMMSEKPECEYKLTTAKKVIEKYFDEKLYAIYPEIKALAEDLSKNCQIKRVKFLYEALVETIMPPIWSKKTAEKPKYVPPGSRAAPSPSSSPSTVSTAPKTAGTPTTAPLDDARSSPVASPQQSPNDEWESVTNKSKKTVPIVSQATAKSGGGKGDNRDSRDSNKGKNSSDRDRKEASLPPPKKEGSVGKPAERRPSNAGGKSESPTTATSPAEPEKETSSRYSNALAQFSKGNMLLTDLELELKHLPEPKLVRFLFEKLATEKDVAWVFEVAGMLFAKSILSEETFYYGCKEFVKATKEEIEGYGAIYTVPYLTVMEEALQFPLFLGSLLGKMHIKGLLKTSFMDEFHAHVKSVEESTNGECEFRNFSSVVDKFQSP